MPIMRWEPLWPFGDDNWGKLFGDLKPMREAEGFMPKVDVYQTEKDVVVEASLPGIDPEHVDISLENDVLTIQGKTESKTEVDDKEYYRKEIRTGSFYRSVPLPVPVMDDKAEATFAGGMLTVTIPKEKPDKKGSRKIEIKKLAGKK